MTEPVAPPPPREVLFSEQGASWLWVLAGPGAGVAMALIQMSAGYFQWAIPVAFFVLVTFFLAIQVKAARIHTSVELTDDTLRQGTETTRTADIVRVYPEADGAETPQWQYARALGELTGVPRGRTGIGLRLAGDRTAQAWARKDKQLRAALTNLIEERIPPEKAS
ncbi:DUF3093 domain-containing protein [Mycolicibacterium sp. 3033]|nr:DUF3093 domain-containing protein [Mycolicibacterium aurantiacum]